LATGNRDFVAGNLVDVLKKKVEPDHSRPRIFSPFGLGVLDLAVGSLVLEAAISSEPTIALPDLFQQFHAMVGPVVSRLSAYRNRRTDETRGINAGTD
jgi:hypothetical protein